MVRVLKKDKSLQGFQQKKITKACVGAGIPEPVAKGIASVVYIKVKEKDKVSSTMIRKMVFSVIDKVAKAKDKWIKYEEKKKSKKATKKKCVKKKK